MTQKVKVLVHWYSRESGGRYHPPSGLTYSTVAKFADIQETWPAEAWSVVLELPGDSGTQDTSNATMRFLVSDAPKGLLYRGSKFELIEGEKRVAVGEVIGE